MSQEERTLRSLRSAAIMPDQSSRMSALVGRVATQARHTAGGSIRFPDNATRIRYMQGVISTQQRQALVPLSQTSAPTPSVPTPSVPTPPVPVPMPTTGTPPGPPRNIIALPDNSGATITWNIPFSEGSSPIIGYKISSIPAGYTDIILVGTTAVATNLINGTSYTFNIIAYSAIGDGDTGQSNVVFAGAPRAPIITSTFPTNEDVIITFTPPTNNGAGITNYKYSLNGGSYVALTPADAVSPITISGLLATTQYTISLRAVNSRGDGAESNQVSITTFTTRQVDIFTTPGAHTWTAPSGVSFVQYLIVGGGGGGGGTYSKINVLGDVPVTSTPQSGYWINEADLTNNRYKGRLYFGTTNIYQNSSSFADPVRLTASKYFQAFNYPYNAWYNAEIVYSLTSSLPSTTNYFSPYQINSTYCNNISGGSGGGAGGQVKILSGASKYDVSPGASYTVIVGAGGAGGSATTNSESVGLSGEPSSFDSIVSLGGSGGAYSRLATTTTNGYGTGGNGGQSAGMLVGGKGGSGLGAAQSNYGLYNSGSAGGFGATLNFDGNGNKSYGAGGRGGVPNTIETSDAAANIGIGGNGTGAELNSFASGRNGGSGIVMIKYYT